MGLKTFVILVFNFLMNSKLIELRNIFFSLLLLAYFKHACVNEMMFVSKWVQQVLSSEIQRAEIGAK
jgi:hypothetical protein